MSHDEYVRKRAWLEEVLKDATDRGDYYLEMDTREQLVALMDRYYEEDEA